MRVSVYGGGGGVGGGEVIQGHNVLSVHVAVLLCGIESACTYCPYTKGTLGYLSLHTRMFYTILKLFT